jgi:hypothetical protein
MIMTTDDAIAHLRGRYDSIRRELAEITPYTIADHKHLNADTPERAYWHYGYCAALKDVLGLLSGELDQKSDSKDTSS